MSLYDNGEPNDLALSLRERFEAVYIDEYQDVNALQDKIFRAVSRPDNRFMVGDIKQSIYGFRSAKPEIFSSMKKTLPSIESSDGEPAASVFMSRNFRCDRGVVDFVNRIFDTPFTLTRDSIGYTDLDRLKFSKIYEGDEPPYKAPEVTLFDKSEETKAALGEEHSEFAPRFVAKKIKELLDTGTLNSNQPIRPSDIAIILRKGSARAKVYKDALADFLKIQSKNAAAKKNEGKKSKK